MILPIAAFGMPSLRKKSIEISKKYNNLDILISNMFDTLYKSEGVGLAAPQINKSIRLFIVDTNPFINNEEQSDFKPIKKVFINPIILDESGPEWSYNEGCLSIPNIREDISRKEKILIQYQDENFITKTEDFTGINARVIQHEYDHIEGVLFIDRISALRKRMLKRKLNDIVKGKVKVNYKMQFSK